MHCLSAPRVLRKTSAADDKLCWGNVSLLPESQARACGFSTQATLCKKHYDEKKQIKELLPITCDQDCHGNLVSCPRRLFPVFDCLGKNLNTGTFICEAHLKLADKDKRICDNEAYKKGKTFAFVKSTLSRKITLCNKTICGSLRPPHPRPQTPPVTDLFV